MPVGPRVVPPVVTITSRRVLITTQYLYGLNHWHGRPINVYLEQRRAWEKVFSGTWAVWGVSLRRAAEDFDGSEVCA